MKKLLFIASFLILGHISQAQSRHTLFIPKSILSTPMCTEYEEIYNIPSFHTGDLIKDWNLAWGDFTRERIFFDDGIKGFVLIGGISGRYFVGDDSGAKIYLSSRNRAIRALYIYKKMGCFTQYR